MPNARLRVYKHFFKRVLDIVLGLIALPFVLIVFIVFAPMIYLEDKGPVFYNAPRVGKNGKPFVMYKFRSMYVNAPDLKMEDGSTYNGADDPRMTKIGAFMRKTSMAPVIIGTPGDGEPTKSLSHPENSSLDLQKCERRPGTSLGARHHYTNFQFLSFAVFGGPEGASGRPLCACVQAPFAAVGTVA